MLLRAKVLVGIEKEKLESERRRKKREGGIHWACGNRGRVASFEFQQTTVRAAGVMR